MTSTRRLWLNSFQLLKANYGEQRENIQSDLQMALKHNLLWIIYGSLTLSFTLWKSHPPLTHVLLSHCLAPSLCIYLPPWPLKGIVHPGIKILSSFTHPHVAPNLHDILSSVQHEEKFWGMLMLLECNGGILWPGSFKQTQQMHH